MTGRRGIVQLFLKQNMGEGWGDYALKWSVTEKKQQHGQRGRQKMQLDPEDPDSDADDFEDADEDFQNVALRGNLDILGLLRMCMAGNVCPRCGKADSVTSSKCSACGQNLSFLPTPG
jgi:hypothetical protein